MEHCSSSRGGLGAGHLEIQTERPNNYCWYLPAGAAAGGAEVELEAAVVLLAAVGGEQKMQPGAGTVFKSSTTCSTVVHGCMQCMTQRV